jgi:hypothetical protein
LLHYLLIVALFADVNDRNSTHFLRTEDSISPTGVNDYDSDEDNDSDLDSVAAGLMDRDGYFVYDVEDDTLVMDDAAMEAVTGNDDDVTGLTDAFDMADFFDYFEDNIEWGGHEYDHNRLAAISEDIDEGNGVDAGIDDIGDTDNMIMSSAAVDG